MMMIQFWTKYTHIRIFFHGLLNMLLTKKWPWRPFVDFIQLNTTSHSSKKTKAENDQNLKIQKLYIVLTEVASTNINSNTANQYIIKQKKNHNSNFWVFFNIHLSVMLILCGLKMGLEMLLVGLLISITTSEIHQGTACNRKKGVVALLNIFGSI